MFGFAGSILDKFRRLGPFSRAYLIYVIYGIRFRRFGRHSKLFGVRAISVGRDVCAGDFCWIEAVTKYAGTEYSPKLIIGSGVAISDLTHISCANHISIGADCLLGSKIYIGDHSHGEIGNLNEILHVPPARRPLGDIGEVIIGEKTWICDGAVILAGSNIASSSIIAANSVVRIKETRPALIGGTPARVIRYLDEGPPR